MKNRTSKKTLDRLIKQYCSQFTEQSVLDKMALASRPIEPSTASLIGGSHVSCPCNYVSLRRRSPIRPLRRRPLRVACLSPFRLTRSRNTGSCYRITMQNRLMDVRNILSWLCAGQLLFRALIRPDQGNKMWHNQFSVSFPFGQHGILLRTKNTCSTYCEQCNDLRGLYD